MLTALTFLHRFPVSEFLKAIPSGGGLESNVAKLESEFPSVNDLLAARAGRLKKVGLPCKQVGLPVVLHRRTVFTYSQRT